MFLSGTSSFRPGTRVCNYYTFREIRLTNEECPSTVPPTVLRLEWGRLNETLRVSSSVAPKGVVPGYVRRTHVPRVLLRRSVPRWVGPEHRVRSSLCLPRGGVPSVRVEGPRDSRLLISHVKGILKTQGLDEGYLSLSPSLLWNWDQGKV